MDEKMLLTLLQLSRLAAMIYFTLLSQVGKTEEEIEQDFKETYAEFKKKDPAELLALLEGKGDGKESPTKE